MVEQRRAPRYVVTNVSAVLLATIDGKLIDGPSDVMTVETARQVPLGRECELVLHTHAGQTSRLSGRVASSRLGEIRTLANGRTVNVYVTGIAVAGPAGGPAQVQEAVTLEIAYDAMVKNMSPFGALLETELPLMVGSSSTIVMRSPEASFQARIAVAFSRESVDLAGEKLRQFGVEFIAIDLAQREAIEKFVFRVMG